MKASKSAPNRRTAERREITRIRRDVCKRLREMVAPLLYRGWWSGMGSQRKEAHVFDFSDTGMCSSYKVPQALGDEFRENGVQAFYTDGVALSGRECLVAKPFEDICVEDLLQIEKLVVRLLPRMQAVAKAFKADVEERARKAADDAQSGDTCVGCVHRHYVVADERGTSMTGWGCLQTGGHAVKRCGMFSRG